MALIINDKDVGDPPATNVVGNTRNNYTLIQNLQAQINELPTGGGNVIGTYTYVDTNVQNISANTETNLTNAGVAGINFPIPGIPDMWDTVKNEIMAAGNNLSLGDVVQVGLVFNMTTTSNNQRVGIRTVTSIGSPSEALVELVNNQFKTSGVQSFVTNFIGDVQNADQLNFPSDLRVESDSDLIINLNSLFFLIIKR